MQGVLSVTQDSQIRKKWNGISVGYGVKITLQDLYNFQMEFEQLRYNMAHLTDGECHRHLMSKFPGQLVKDVHDEETRLHVSQPQVIIELPGNHAVSVIKENMEQLLKISATKVVKNKPGEYLFTLSELSDVKRALEADGRPLRGTSQKLSVQQVKRQLSIDAIFEHLSYKLESRERADQHFRNSNYDRSRSPQRNVRVTDSEDQQKKRG